MRFITFSRVLMLLMIAFSTSCLLSACSKSDLDSGDHIQQGSTVIQVNAIYPQSPAYAGLHTLQIRYNNVIDAPIYLKLRFNLTDGGHLDLPVTLPAGYQNLQRWSEDTYLNILDYVGGATDTLTGILSPLPPLSSTLDIKSLVIISATTPDKKYGFQVLGGNDDWSFYHPTELHSSIGFTVNNEDIAYSDYDFSATHATFFRNNNSRYTFGINNIDITMISDVAAFPLQEGVQMGIPYFRYYFHNRNYGYALGPEVESSNGSTVQLKVTKLTATHFAATFSGKVWSAISPDTLFITNGVMENMPLPDSYDSW